MTSLKVHPPRIPYYRLRTHPPPGVNLQEENQMSLHTLANCTMPDTRTMTGITNATNCDYAFDYNTDLHLGHVRKWTFVYYC